MPLYRATIARNGRVVGCTFWAPDAAQATTFAYDVIEDIEKAIDPKAEVLTVKETPNMRCPQLPLTLR